MTDERDALFSPCRRYRYSLLRVWTPGLPRVTFIMLNPSTADASQDDPTIRRCLGFARAWGFGSLEVGNLFALRSPHPGRLRVADDPIGPENDRTLVAMTLQTDMVVVAWGSYPAATSRAEEVLPLFGSRPLHCLGLNRDGQPRHPLYLSRETTLAPYL